MYNYLLKISAVNFQKKKCFLKFSGTNENTRMTQLVLKIQGLKTYSTASTCVRAHSENPLI